MALPWLFVMWVWIFHHNLGQFEIGKSTIDLSFMAFEFPGFRLNLWAVLLFIWPIAIIKLSWNSQEPDEIAVIYFARGLALGTTNAGHPCLICPGLMSISKDTNTNLVDMITAVEQAEIDKDFSKEEQENLMIHHLNDVTTGSPELVNWEEKDENGNLIFSEEDKKRILKDPNHKQIVLQPTVVITTKKSNLVLYVENVAGENPEKRKKEFGRQVALMVKSTINTEFKKYTYAMLIFLQTKDVLDKALTRDVKTLIEKGKLGLDCLDSRVIALGASKSIHDAVNDALAEVFVSDKKEIAGKGDKLKAIQVAEGEKVRLTQEGEGKALALKAYLEEAKNAGVDATRMMELQAEVTAFEKSKHTYLTSRSGSGNDYDKIALMIASAITEAKGGAI
ncbi:MAG: hypothetical protein V4439_00830 [Patescibacteria group bacterium]